MTSVLVFADVPLAAVFAGVGLVFGLAYFAALWRTVALLGAGSSWTGPVVLTLGRITGIVLVLAVAVRFGALPLGAAFVGVSLARLIALRIARRTA